MDDVDWKTVPGVEPFDLELLRQLPSRQLLDAGWYFTGSLYWNHWFLAHPMACQSMSDLRDVEVAACQSVDVEYLLGERLLNGHLDGLAVWDRNWLTGTAGAALVNEYHADRIRELQEEVEQWLARGWDAVREHGTMSGEEQAAFAARPNVDLEPGDFRRHWEWRPGEPPAPERVDPGEPHDAESLRIQTAAELLAAVLQSSHESPERLVELGAILGEQLLAEAFPDLEGENLRAVAWRVGRAVVPIYRAVKLPLAEDEAL